MRLEEAIKQKTPFRSQEEKLVVNIFFTCSWMQEQMRLFLAPFNITMQQYNVLRILRGQHPRAIALNDIRERLLDKMSDVSRLADRLVKTGWAEKIKDKYDKRLVLINITAKGLTLLGDIDEELPNLDRVMQQLSGNELFITNQLLDKLRG